MSTTITPLLTNKKVYNNGSAVYQTTSGSDVILFYNLEQYTAFNNKNYHITFTLTEVDPIDQVTPNGQIVYSKVASSDSPAGSVLITNITSPIILISWQISNTNNGYHIVNLSITSRTTAENEEFPLISYSTLQELYAASASLTYTVASQGYLVYCYLNGSTFSCEITDADDIADFEANIKPDITLATTSADAKALAIINASPLGLLTNAELRASPVPMTGSETDNIPNPTTKLPVLAAVATVSAPTWTDGYVTPLSVDTTGALRVSGTISATNPSVGSNNSAIPTSSSLIAGSDGTNLRPARIFDLDTGGGTEYDLGVSIRLPSSGGSVVGGSQTDPLRIDPTGTTAQPITDNAGSLTIDNPTLSVVGGGTEAAAQRVTLANDSSGKLITFSAPYIIKQLYDIQTTVIYIGYSALGNLSSNPVWSIKKTTLDGSGNPTSVLWSSSTAIWDNRASETYT